MSSAGRFLVTGAMGCIGAWAVRELVAEGTPVVVFDRSTDPRRLRLLLTPEELARVTLVAGDVTDVDALGATLDEHAIDHVIHLAALQIPLVRADPIMGARVNVVGTVAVFEAVRARLDRMAPVVYAGSVGMFDMADADPGTHRLAADATAHPGTLYGVTKLANEGTASVYWHENRVPSVGLRPMTVYGVGRDQGMTSTPTKAMAAAVLGLDYRITFGGSTLYQYARDAARTFIVASRSGHQGAMVANLGGSAVHMREVVAAIETEVPEARGRITFEEQPLPFPDSIDSSGLAPLGPVPVTPFAEGVAETVARFRDLAARGVLTAAEAGI
ncbi:MAG: NAD(P)-dependent oxidoreductase [Chloroflexi bacterium]|nr:NAD(P)-dependent oxidoreductase [Chloroflexota bacterium]